MNDAVSRSAVLAIIDALRDDDRYPVDLDWLARDIKVLPRLDAVPVVHARWIVKRMAGETIALQCSACKNCDNPSKVRGNYCWSCGAKMDGDIDG